MVKKRVLNVGQCNYDHGNITEALTSRFDVEVVPVHDAEEATSQASRGGYSLVLINRIFDRDGTSGVELIRTLKSNPDTASIPVMLVSNFSDAQAEAIGLGAVPGFGKANVGKPAMLESVEPFLKG